MNNITTVGAYYQSGGSDSMPANAPPYAPNAFILVTTARTNDRIQIWSSINGERIFYRIGTGIGTGSASWGNWIELATKNDIDASTLTDSSFTGTLCVCGNLATLYIYGVTITLTTLTRTYIGKLPTSFAVKYPTYTFNIVGNGREYRFEIESDRKIYITHIGGDPLPSAPPTIGAFISFLKDV